MKKILTSCLLWGLFCTAQATPRNLYEQLCEVNQEWRKNREIATQLGFLNAPIINNEQELLVFHIQTLEKIFLARIPALPTEQQEARAQHLKVLHTYWQRRDCPRNYYLPYRNPVFIDHQGRYCAVAYLMQKSGKQAFCEAVQKSSNFIFVRQIQHPEFHAWQQASGLSLDELAWIQPGYSPVHYFIDWDKRDAKGNLIEFDSAQTFKIYNANYDNTDMFGFQRIFWGMRAEPAYMFKKLKPAYQGKPDWTKLNESVTSMIVHQNELYVATDSTTYQGEKYINRSSVMRWNKQTSNWDIVLKLNSETKVYSFFQSKGRLYAGGGSTYPYEYDAEGNIIKEGYQCSFLASTTTGKDWKIATENYGGAVFGLIYKNKKRYLGVVNDGLSMGGGSMRQNLQKRIHIAQK